MSIFKSLLFFIFLCCSFCYSAQINVNDILFTFNAATRPWEDQNGTALTSAGFHRYISDIIAGNALTPDRQDTFAKCSQRNRTNVIGSRYKRNI